MKSKIFRNVLLIKCKIKYNFSSISTDIRLHLKDSDYVRVLDQSTPYALTVACLNECLYERLTLEFHYIRNQSVEPLSTFLDYIRYQYMIDNTIFLLSGIMNQKSMKELLPKCHPLGTFDEMHSVQIASNPTELYNAVLIDTPLAQFFTNRIVELDFRETNIEILKNILHKAHLEAFYKFCQDIGGTTGDVMSEILAV